MPAASLQDRKDGPLGRQSTRPDEPDPPLAEWMASSNDFLLVKQFSALNVRVIRMKQAILEEKELELLRMDTSAEYRSPTGGFLDDKGSPRHQLLCEIAHLSKDYNDYVLSSFAMRRQAPATARQVRNVQNYLTANPNAISIDDRLLDDPYDLVSVESRPRSIAQTFAERYHRGGAWSLFAIATNTVSYYDGSQRGSFANAIARSFSSFIVILELAMFLVPLGTLPLIPTWRSRIGMVASLLVAFAAMTLLTTTWRSTKLMIAFAGYFIILLLVIIATIAIDLQRTLPSANSTR